MLNDLLLADVSHYQFNVTAVQVVLISEDRRSERKGSEVAMGNVNERHLIQRNDTRTRSASKRMHECSEMPSTSHPYEISPHPKRPRSIFSLPSRSPEFHPPPLRCFSAMESEQMKIDSGKI
ncbi:hypothetical protein Tcan_09973 [Toxocara canis]|uniref:Uncharacterized protein n=1 Tax=Toxocara canis TaxID=6265 RepID=A0A0B2USK1_TOXCA|nr:hypothetical protein Tcan_09973 [Toxocara canis]